MRENAILLGAVFRDFALEESILWEAFEKDAIDLAITSPMSVANVGDTLSCDRFLQSYSKEANCNSFNCCSKTSPNSA
jgi:hypothetical protein